MTAHVPSQHARQRVDPGQFRRRALPQGPANAGPSLIAFPAVLAVGGYFAWLFWALDNATYDVIGGIIALPVLVIVGGLIVRKATASETDGWIVKLIWWAFFLKLASVLPRFWAVEELYGRGDAQQYDVYGKQIAETIRSEGLGVIDLGSQVVGTGFIRLVTGIVYTITGPSEMAGYFVFSWLAFFGLLCFYKAFRTALPDGAHRRYAVLVFLLPTLLFWPSSIGKEAWMTFTVGLAAYGTARVLARRRGGAVILALGLWGTSMVRPHITLIVFAGVFAAYLLRRDPGRADAAAPIAKIVGVLVLLAASSLVLGRVQAFFEIDSVTGDSVESVIDYSMKQSTQKGSEFQPARLTNPAQAPAAVVTVLFRPFPTEAHNLQALGTAAEGTVLMLLCLRWRRSLYTLPRRVFRTPYVAMAAIFVALFIYAFSAIGNFGILARQRTQLYPWFAVMLCVPAAPPTSPISRYPRREDEPLEVEVPQQ